MSSGGKKSRTAAPTPGIKLPKSKDVILCHSTAVTIATEPDDAVLCFTILDLLKNPISPTMRRSATGGLYAGNIDFGPLPAGDAILQVCYSKDGTCTTPCTDCSTVAVNVECRGTSLVANAAAKPPAKSGK